MKFIGEFMDCAYLFRKGPFGATRVSLQSLWAVYTKPTLPVEEAPKLLSMCSIIAIVTGVLLYYWMTESLRYGHGTSSTTACVYSLAIVFLSFISHPLRCVLTMILPTLGTKQGRKLMLSTSMMFLVFNIIPNITINMGVLMHVLTCTSEGLAHSFLNSSELFHAAKRDLVREAIKVKEKDLNIVSKLITFDHFTHIDVSEVKNTFVTVSKQIESDFSHAKNLLVEYKLLTNKILAAIFLFCLIVESARYLKSYVTSVSFDNVYITRQLLKKASKNGIQVKQSNLKNIVNSTSFKITKQEFNRCLSPMAVVTLYFIVVVFLMALDHIVYHLVTVSGPWLIDIPPTSVYIHVKYKVQWHLPGLCVIPPLCREWNTDVVNFHQQYEWTFSPGMLKCDMKPSAPHVTAKVSLGILCLLSYITVFLEVFARRIRRKVSASFFKEQEEKRIIFLLKKIQAKQDKKKNIYFSLKPLMKSASRA